MNGCKSALTKTDVFPQYIDSHDKTRWEKQPILSIDLKRRDSLNTSQWAPAEGFVCFQRDAGEGKESL